MFAPKDEQGIMSSPIVVKNGCILALVIVVRAVNGLSGPFGLDAMTQE